ncbi:MAG TPA: nucleoside deaminase [Polyangiales bacterium]|nr:nucleoside deaminase [Polyangiales bacterium]
MAGTDLELVITVPGWLDEVLAAHREGFASDEARMRYAIALSAENVRRGGGPFGAAVFAGDQHVASGVNRVLETRYSLAHAEIVAILNAQRVLAREPELAKHPLSLVTSAEPCCQCFGALVWSGVDRLVCGATTADVETIGFDEGPKPERWPETLLARSITTREGIEREAAREVLLDYQRRGGTIYGFRG